MKVLKVILDILKFLVQIFPYFIELFTEKKKSRAERKREAKEREELDYRLKHERPSTMGDWSEDESTDFEEVR